MNTNFSSEALQEFWRATLDPQGRGLCEAFAEDIAAFTNEPVSDVDEKGESGVEAFKELWFARAPDPHDKNAVAAFYQNQFVEAYELADWHCGRTKGLPLNYAFAATLAAEMKAKTVLDFGSGIGSGVLCFSRAGCAVTAADVADRLLDFVSHRANRHGVGVELIYLNRGNKPRPRSYDLIACFDVLEHIPDQLSKLRELESYLKVGGALVTNLFRDSVDADHPMHVSSAVDPLRLVRQTGMLPEWRWWHNDHQVLILRRGGRLRNRLASLRD